MKKNETLDILSENKKAYHDFQILEKTEVGIQLSGAEVKSVREKHVNLSGSYVAVLHGELWLIGSTIARYVNASSFSLWHSNFSKALQQQRESYTAENRNRKLLCHRKELNEFKFKTEAKGLTLIPLKIYTRNGRIKLEIALARGKNTVDKRDTLKRRDIDRDLKRS